MKENLISHLVKSKAKLSLGVLFLFSFAMVLPALALPNALDAPGFSWSLSGGADWFNQDATTHDGVDAGESGDIDDNQSTSLETTVTGPGELTFWWKVSSEGGWDYLRFFLDDAEVPGVTGISGDVDWSLQTVTIPAGSHTLRWTYAKDGSVSELADAGWVDEVAFNTPLSLAVDAPGFGLGTNGEADWSSQTVTTHDGVDAGESGDIDDNQSTSLETTVTGPGELTFWWKVSSEGGWDYLRFFLDDAEVPGVTGISGDVDWSLQTVTIPAGSHTLRWTYAKDGSVSELADAGWVDELAFNTPFILALDAPGFGFETNGEADWFSQTVTTHDGVDAGESGDIDDNQSTSLETTVTGPGELTFWWKVSSEGGWDYLRFFLDDAELPEVAGISGDVDWSLQTVTIPAGSHTLRWTYAKDGSVSELADAGWVDELAFQPGSQPGLQLLLSPEDVVFGGQRSGDLFEVGVVGTAPGVNNWPSGENPGGAIDGLGQKYLHFGEENTGIVVSPAVGASIATSMTLWTANDGPERDPASFELYGTMADPGAGPFDLNQFNLIASGGLALPETRNPGGSAPLATANSQTVFFDNSNVYTTYLIVFPTVKNSASANSMQVAEIQLNGQPTSGLTGFDLWAATNISPGEDADFGGFSGNPETPNGLRYAFGNAPIESPGPGVLTAPAEVPNDVVLTLEYSGDLVGWDTTVSWTDGIPDIVYPEDITIDGGVVTDTYRDLNGRGFWRYRANQVP